MIRMLAPELEALMVDATSIHPHPHNPNNGDTEAIVESMVTDGVYRPIYASRASGNIVAGHHVYEALLSQGMDRVPVLFLDVDEEEELRILAKDNRIAQLAWMDPALELALVKRIASTEQGLVGTGYDDQWMLKAVTAASVPFVPQGDLSSVQVTCPNCEHTFDLEMDL